MFFAILIRYLFKKLRSGPTTSPMEPPSSSPPPPYLFPYAHYKKKKGTVPKDFSQTNSFFEFHPIEVARQLSIMDFEALANIKLEEFFFNGWTQPDKETRSPHILQFIKRFNMVYFHQN